MGSSLLFELSRNHLLLLSFLGHFWQHYCSSLETPHFGNFNSNIFILAQLLVRLTIGTVFLNKEEWFFVKFFNKISVPFLFSFLSFWMGKFHTSEMQSFHSTGDGLCFHISLHATDQRFENLHHLYFYDYCYCCCCCGCFVYHLDCEVAQ